MTLPSFHLLRARLKNLGVLAEPSDLWPRVAEARFTLARQGQQVHLVDLMIAVVASAYGCLLLTRDKDFLAIARVVPLDVEVC